MIPELYRRCIASSVTDHSSKSNSSSMFLHRRRQMVGVRLLLHANVGRVGWGWALGVGVLNDRRQFPAGPNRDEGRVLRVTACGWHFFQKIPKNSKKFQKFQKKFQKIPKTGSGEQI